MREAFRAYILPTGEEFKTLWKQAIFSFDASVLLNVYGYSDSTREDLLSLLERLSERVRLPHQFGLEFVRDRVRVITKQIGNYRRVEDQLKKTRDENFSPRSEHPFPSKKSLRAYEALLKELANDRMKMEKLISDDVHGRRVVQIFNGRVGAQPSAEELDKLHAVAKARYQNKIPPGYKDKDKGEPDSFKDYVGWCQLIEIAKKEGKDLIFVCDDLKEDWWYLENGRTIGPRYELIEEFLRASGRFFYMYNSERFLRYANAYLEETIKEDVIAEVSGRLAANNEMQLASTLKPFAEQRVSETNAMKPGIIPEEPDDSDIKPEQPGLSSSSSKPQKGDKP